MADIVEAGEYYIAKRAIILAAGIGVRMRPVTNEIPKPLVRIHGTRIIDSIINGLHGNGIYEIYVVVGYHKEQFRDLELQYEGLRLIENPYYETYNNISSLYMARNYIKDVIILDGDQVICNKAVLNPYFKRSCYHCIWTDVETKEWILNIKNGIVQSCNRNGGKNGWQLYSISYWTVEDGERLKRHLEEEFIEKGNGQIYWDDVALFLHSNEYCLGIREMNCGDVLEIDSLDELITLDNDYQIFKQKE